MQERILAKHYFNVLCVLLLIIVALTGPAQAWSPPFSRKNRISRKNRSNELVSCRRERRRGRLIHANNNDFPSSLYDDSNDDFQTEQQRIQRLTLLDQAQQQVQASELARKQILSIKDDNNEGTIITTGGDSNIVLTRTDAGTLVVDLPSPGFSANSLMSGAFSVAWFSVVVPATFSGAGLFMLPFWAAGAAVAKTAVVDPFTDVRLTIGEYAWSLTSTLAGKTRTLREGATSELGGAQLDVKAVQTTTTSSSGRRRRDVVERLVYKVKLLGTRKETTLMVPTATVDELQGLCDEINKHLQSIKEKNSASS